MLPEFGDILRRRPVVQSRMIVVIWKWPNPTSLSISPKTIKSLMLVKEFLERPTHQDGRKGREKERLEGKNVNFAKMVHSNKLSGDSICNKNLDIVQTKA